MQEQIKEIRYKNQVIDTGIVLGSRLHKGLLRKRFAPLYAVIDNEFVSSVSPHRENCLIYIPEFYLEPGTIITVIDKNEHLILEVKEKINGFVFFKSPEKNKPEEKLSYCDTSEVGF